jgi:hypothetical protein
VCNMEDVLELYHQAYDPLRPVVCFDEGTKQLIGETRTPWPMRVVNMRKVHQKQQTKSAPLGRHDASNFEAWARVSLPLSQ